MTNRAMIYRPSSRWHTVAAFTAAVAIHLSAVAIASLHREEPTVNPGNDFAIIDADPGEESPAQPQMEIPVETPPQLVSPPEFVEPQQPISKTRSFTPIRMARQTSTGFTANPRALTLSVPRPDYPYEARSRHIIGSGIAAMSVDLASGLVKDVVMEQSIGNPILDNSAISAFKRWQFKSGVARKVRVPITFKMTGAEY
jgi:TonB family protein